MVIWYLGVQVSEMVERVARAIAAKRHGPMEDVEEVVEWGIPRVLGDAWGTSLTAAKPFRAPLWRLYEEDARAAIAAMREPTEAMLESQWQATRAVSPERRMQMELCSPADSAKAKAAERWRAMIDEALR